MPPASAPELEPQVLIVPLLAFDAEGYRLGYVATEQNLDSLVEVRTERLYIKRRIDENAALH